MKISLSLSVLSCLLGQVACVAQWALIDDFQQGNAGDVFPEASDIGWSAASVEGTDEYWILEDPADSTNRALFIESGNYGLGYGTVFVVKELPMKGIRVGETGTIHLRYRQSGPENILYVGTSNRPMELDPVTGAQTVPGAFGDYNAVFSLRDSTAPEGGSQLRTDPEVEFLDNTWYELYLVVHNTFLQLEGTWTSTGRYSLYRRASGEAEPVLVRIGTDPPLEAPYVRRAPLSTDGEPEDIIWITFSTNSGAPGSPNAGDLFFVDDVYFSKGINLQSPVRAPNPWAPSYVNEAKDVDTGDWMGWINAWHAPLLWIYSLDSWVYMEDPDSSDFGAWGYFYK